MNVTEPPFDDIRVRLALKVLVDHHQMIDVVLRGHGTSACNNPVRPTDQYYWPQSCNQDIDKAVAWLADAGYPNGLRIELATSDISPDWLPIAELYQAQAARAGVDVELNFVPANGYWNNTWMVHPFAHSWWSARAADPVLNLMFRCGARFGETFWCNEEIEQVMEDARREVSFERRKGLYQRAQQLQVEEAGMIAPFFVNDIRVLSTRLQGLPAETIWQEFPWHEFRIVEP